MIDEAPKICEDKSLISLRTLKLNNGWIDKIYLKASSCTVSFVVEDEMARL